MRHLLLISSLIFCTPLWAQKQLVPVVRALEKGAVQGVPAASSASAVQAAVTRAAWAARAGTPAVSAGGITHITPQMKDAIEMARVRKIHERMKLRQRPPLLEEEVKKSYFQVEALWEARFKNPASVPLLGNVYAPTLSPTPTSLRNNEMSLFFSERLADKLDWLRARPYQGENDLFTLMSSDAIDYLAAALTKEKMIMLGELHHSPSVQRAVERLIVKLQWQNPGRRIVLFTEFIDLPPVNPGPRNTVATYYRRPAEEEILPVALAPWEDAAETLPYATETFADLLGRGMEIYPLEDPTQKDIFEGELMIEEDNSLFYLTERNKIWARVIETKMAEVRRTDPDALFIVYAGMGHTSWLTPFSVPKMFASETPAVVEITENTPSVFNALYPVWGKNHMIFDPCGGTSLLYHWRGEDARLLGRQTGFDYAFVVPGR